MQITSSTMALYRVLAKFDALDAKIGRDKIPRARLPTAARPALRINKVKMNADKKAKTRSFGSFGRTGASLGARPEDSDGVSEADDSTRSRKSHFDREFYFLRVAVESNDVDLDVHITDLTSPDRPSFAYRNVHVNDDYQIIFRDEPIPGFGPETLNVISPVDDFPFVTKCAQMLGHTLRVRVMSNRTCLVDTSAGAKYDATDPDRIDPDQLLEELNGHAAMVQYKAWSPKASQANEFFK
eukprot:g4061.t1